MLLNTRKPAGGTRAQPTGKGFPSEGLRKGPAGSCGIAEGSPVKEEQAAQTRPSWTGM